MDFPDCSRFVRGSEAFVYIRRYPSDTAKKVFQAANSGDATLLNEILQTMDGNEIERAFTLKTKMDACRLYQAYFTTKVTPLIVAVKKGNLDCVKVLLKYKADIEGRGGEDDVQNCYMYENCTPLFVAAVQGNLDVLSFLIERGANVNACTNDQCTPLMVAVKYGHVKVVDFLVKHGGKMDLQDKKGDQAIHYAFRQKNDSCEVLNCLIETGADVNACTTENCTPLMIASENKKINQVSFLIEHGANIDLQDKHGNTALHYAVVGNSPKVADKLLTLGALQLPNSHHLTPLLSASNSCISSMVEDFIIRPECSREDRINALELLGASLVTKQPPGTFMDYDVASDAFQLMRRGMEERYSHPSYPLLKQPLEPFKAYQNREESITLEELDGIEFDDNAIMMEGLMIRERILGAGNEELLVSIRRVADYHSHGEISICIGLYIHAMKIARSCNESAISDVNSITSLLYDKIFGNNSLRQEDLPVVELLEQMVIEFERQQSRGVKIDSFVFRPFESRDLYDSFKKLVQIIAKYDFNIEETDSYISELLKKLCLLNPTTFNEDTLLHEAIDSDSLHIPCPDAVKILLNAGFNVDAVNNEGNTPLHVAVTCKSKNSKVHLLVLEALFNGGAHHDFVNNDGKTPMDLAQADEVRMILSERRKLELKCISARAVKKFGIPYVGVVPKTLETFVKMH